jgi:threonyl-tRNA synthetase
MYLSTRPLHLPAVVKIDALTLNTVVFKPAAELLKIRNFYMPTIKYIVPGFRNAWQVSCTILDRYDDRYLIEYYDEMSEDWVTVMCTRQSLVFPKFSELII